jgi:hypothetical protein
MEEINHIVNHITTMNPALPNSQQELINNLSFIITIPTTTMFILYAIYEEYFSR